MDNKNLFKKALKHTHILKMPKQNISTFGTTNVDYYVLSSLKGETRIRNGKVISHRPEIISPSKISEIFEGFGEDTEDVAKELYQTLGKNPKMLNYRFSNKHRSVSESGLTLYEVFKNIKKEIEKKGNNLSAIIKGDEDTWQISIMKFIVEFTLKSADDNITDLEERGMFPDSDGVPVYIKNKIEYLFKKAKKDKSKIEELGRILNAYGLFSKYEDRFFDLLGTR
ncbi:MAG: hypothetical protein ACOC5R_02280 [Elusimicrobiota bacterium]